MGLAETELRLGLPGNNAGGDHVEVVRKRGFDETVDLELNLSSNTEAADDQVNKKAADSLVRASATDPAANPPAKAQVVGWPPVRSFRKNIMEKQKAEVSKIGEESGGAAFVKVRMDGAPYLRKVDLRMYKTYKELSDALGNMFSSFTNITGNCGSQGFKDFMNEGKLMDVLNNSDYVPTYEDNDGDWMLVGDVPWEKFVESCKRLRIMKGKEAVVYVAPRVMEKCKNRS